MSDTCLICGEGFEPRRRWHDGICSRPCRVRQAMDLGPDLVAEPDEELDFESRVIVRRYLKELRRLARTPPLPPDGRCECCGEAPAPRPDGKRSLNLDHRHDNNLVRGWVCSRCNIQVATLDLRFGDPDRFAKLQAWSLRGAPVVPVRSERPARRVRARPSPTLFDRGDA